MGDQTAGQPPRKRALVVEDEFLIALHTEGMLSDLNVDVVELASNVRTAMSLAQAGDFDFAVLDINLEGEYSYSVADALRRRNIPYIFVSGYGISGVPEDYKADIHLQKPIRLHDLQASIDTLMSK